MEKSNAIIDILAIFVVAAVVVLLLVLQGYLVQLFWNGVLISQGLKHIDLGDGIGLVLLGKLLTGSFLSYKPKGLNKS